MSEREIAGRVLNYEMNKRGITVKQLAEHLNVCPKTVKGYMAGRCALKATTIVAICDYFNITCDYLLGLKDEFGNRLQNSTNRENRHDNSEQ